MTAPELIGQGREALAEAQVWARLVHERPVVVIPSKDEDQPATEQRSLDVALARLAKAERAIVAARKALLEGAP